MTSDAFAAPTDEGLRRGFWWRAAGGALMGAAVLLLVVLFAMNEAPLQGAASNAAMGAFVVFAYGLAALLWGLRPCAQQWEHDSVRRSGMTVAWVGYCTVLAVLFAVAPILVPVLSALPTTEQDRRGG